MDEELKVIDEMLKNCWEPDIRESSIIQLSLGNYRSLCKEKDCGKEFLAETADLPNRVVVQISSDSGPSLVVDESGHLMEFT